MLGFALVFSQLVAAQAAPPDIELNARVQAREGSIREETPATLQVRVQPGDAPPVKVRRSAPAGAKSYRNLSLDLHAEARLAAPSPSQPQQGNTDGDRQP
jgi:hypothetical protein